MRRTCIVVILVISSLVVSATARAQMMDACSHDATIAALQSCVHHAEAHGFIANVGVARSLHAKLDAATAAQNRAQPAVAVSVLEAFVRQVDAQSGRHIDAEHAAHLRRHAEQVIAALTP